MNDEDAITPLEASHAAALVESEPVVRPVDWRLMEWTPDERRIVCVTPDGLSFRMTTAIVDVQPSSDGIAVVTESGRRYELNEPPVANESVLALLIGRADATRPGGRDVSDAFWATGSMPQSKMQPA